MSLFLLFILLAPFLLLGAVMDANRGPDIDTFAEGLKFLFFGYFI